MRGSPQYAYEAQANSAGTYELGKSVFGRGFHGLPQTTADLHLRLR